MPNWSSSRELSLRLAQWVSLSGCAMMTMLIAKLGTAYGFMAGHCFSLLLVWCQIIIVLIYITADIRKKNWER